MIQRWAEISGGRCSIDAILRQGARIRAFWKLHAASATGRASQEKSDASGPTGEASVMPEQHYGRVLPAVSDASAATATVDEGINSINRVYARLSTVNRVTARGVAGYNTPLSNCSVNAGGAGAEGAIPW
jgi:hypothetical protein